jgi:hypothetical protein
LKSASTKDGVQALARRNIGVQTSLSLSGKSSAWGLENKYEVNKRSKHSFSSTYREKVKSLSPRQDKVTSSLNGHAFKNIAILLGSRHFKQDSSNVDSGNGNPIKVFAASKGLLSQAAEWAKEKEKANLALLTRIVKGIGVRLAQPST